MELLILLVERRGHLVTRQEIAERLWGQDVFVDTEHGINTAVRKLRTVLGDNPEQSRFVQTVTGKGYRFVATTTVIPSIAESGSNGQKPEAMPPAGLAAAHDGKQQQKQIVQPNNVRRRMLWVLACCLIAALMIGTASWTMYPGLLGTALPLRVQRLPFAPSPFFHWKTSPAILIRSISRTG